MTKPRWDFPPLLNEIADAAGLEAAMELVRVKGGQRIHIPAYAPQGHWLVTLIGREAADKLCAHFKVRGGGSYIALPLGPKSFYAMQRRQVLDLDHLSVDEVVSRLGVSRSFVKKVRGQHPENDRQGALPL